jgi:ATP-dependent Clp protease ATP-binding subunit ClpA
MVISSFIGSIQDVSWDLVKSTTIKVSCDYRVRLVALGALAALSYLSRVKIGQMMKAHVIDPIKWTCYSKSKEIRNFANNLDSLLGRLTDDGPNFLTAQQAFEILSAILAKNQNQLDDVEWFKKLFEDGISNEELISKADQIIPSREPDISRVKTNHDILTRQLGIWASWLSQIVGSFELDDLSLNKFVKWVAESPRHLITILFNVSLPFLYEQFKEVIFPWVKAVFGEVVAENQGKLLIATLAICYALYRFKRKENGVGVWDLNKEIETGQIASRGLDLIPSQKESFDYVDVCLGKKLENAEHLILYHYDHAPGAPLHFFLQGIVERSVMGRGPQTHQFLQFDLLTFLADDEQSAISKWREEVAKAKAANKIVFLGQFNELIERALSGKVESENYQKLLSIVLDTLANRDIRCITTLEEKHLGKVKDWDANRSIFATRCINRLSDTDTVDFLERAHIPPNRWDVPYLAPGSAAQLVKKIVATKGEHELPNKPDGVIEKVKTACAVARQEPEEAKIIREKIDQLNKKIKTTEAQLGDFDEDVATQEKLAQLHAQLQACKDDLKEIKRKFKEDITLWEKIGAVAGKRLDDARAVEEKLLKKYWKRRRVIKDVSDSQLLKMARELIVIREIITPRLRAAVTEQQAKLIYFPHTIHVGPLLDVTEKIEEQKMSSARSSERARIDEMQEKLKEFAPGRSHEIELFCKVFKAKRIAHDNASSQPTVFILAGSPGGGKSHCADEFGWQVEKALGLHPDGNRLKPENLKGYGMTQRTWKHGAVENFFSTILGLAKKHPHMVFRLDEFDKLTDETQKKFLSLFDNTPKEITKHLHEQADDHSDDHDEEEDLSVKLNNTIFFLTMNIGADGLKEVNSSANPSQTFAENQKLIEEEILKTLGDAGKPFLDRIAAIIPFAPLREQEMKEYVKVFLRKEKQKYQEDQNCQLTLDSSLVEYFYTKAKPSGKDASFSLRVLERMIPVKFSEALIPHLPKNDEVLKAHLTIENDEIKVIKK